VAASARPRPENGDSGCEAIWARMAAMDQDPCSAMADHTGHAC
jgi:hypothetical protein